MENVYSFVGGETFFFKCIVHFFFEMYIMCSVVYKFLKYIFFVDRHVSMFLSMNLEYTEIHYWKMGLFACMELKYIEIVGVEVCLYGIEIHGIGLFVCMEMWYIAIHGMSLFVFMELEKNWIHGIGLFVNWNKLNSWNGHVCFIGIQMHTQACIDEKGLFVWPWPYLSDLQCSISLFYQPEYRNCTHLIVPFIVHMLDRIAPTIVSWLGRWSGMSLVKKKKSQILFFNVIDVPKNHLWLEVFVFNPGESKTMIFLF